MNQPKWLKTSYLKSQLSYVLLKLLAGSLQFSGNQRNHLLITSIDGLGDAFMRLNMVHQFIEHHGKQNCTILANSISAPLFRHCGFNTVNYSNQVRTNPYLRFKTQQKLNQLGLKKVISLEYYPNDPIAGELDCPEVIGFVNMGRKYFSRRLSHELVVPSQYVGLTLAAMARALSISRYQIDNRPYFAASATRPLVIIALGASNAKRMMTLEAYLPILQYLADMMPQSQLLLVGHGKREQVFAQGLMAKINRPKVVNLVGQKSLAEVIELVAQSSLTLCFDSAFYHLAYSLRKSTICLCIDNLGVLHQAAWVVNIQGDTQKVTANPDKLGSDITNSIRLEQVVQAYKRLIKSDIGNNDELVSLTE